VLEPTESVSVELPPALTEAGLSEAVVPEGRPLVLSVTGSAAPLVIAVEIVDVPVPPCVTETKLGFALMAKSFGGGAVTVRFTTVECVALAAVPVTVTGYVPGTVPAPTINVSVELPPAGTEAGSKEAVVPEGTPLELSVTDSAAPLVTAVEMVEVALPPWTAETAEGFALIEKSLGGGGAMIVTVTVVAWVLLGAVPVTVRV